MSSPRQGKRAAAARALNSSLPSIAEMSLFEVIAATSAAGILTLRERGLDSLDFHDVHVSTLAAMLKQAYEAGRQVEREGGR